MTASASDRLGQRSREAAFNRDLAPLATVKQVRPSGARQGRDPRAHERTETGRSVRFSFVCSCKNTPRIVPMAPPMVDDLHRKPGLSDRLRATTRCAGTNGAGDQPSEPTTQQDDYLGPRHPGPRRRPAPGGLPLLEVPAIGLFERYPAVRTPRTSRSAASTVSANVDNADDDGQAADDSVPVVTEYKAPYPSVVIVAVNPSVHSGTAFGRVVWSSPPGVCTETRTQAEPADVTSIGDSDRATIAKRGGLASRRRVAPHHRSRRGARRCVATNALSGRCDQWPSTPSPSVWIGRILSSGEGEYCPARTSTR